MSEAAASGAPGVERFALRVRGLAAAEKHEGFRRFTTAANIVVDGIDPEAEVSAQVVRYYGFTFSHLSLPHARLRWKRETGSASRALLLLAARGGIDVQTEGTLVRRGSTLAAVWPGDEPVTMHLIEPRNELIHIGFSSEILADIPLPRWREGEAPPLEWPVVAPFYAFVKALCATSPRSPEAGTALAVAARAMVRELVAIAAQEHEAPSSLVGAARLIIRDDFADSRVSVSSIARRLRVSPRTLQAAFTDEGTTVSGELRSARIVAARLIKDANPRMPARELAASAGFGSVSAMTRALRQE